MIVFVDESGDLGNKPEKGSSRFFTIALVMFDTPRLAQACQEAIERLHVSLGMPDQYEFKFHDDSHNRRLALLSVVQRHDFHCYTFTLNKTSPRLTSPGLRQRSAGYKWVCKTAFANAAPDLKLATVVIDGSGDRRFRQEMSGYLRRHINESNERQIAKVKIGRSHSDALLQLADYVAGVTNRWYEGKPGAEVYESYESYLRSKRRSARKWP